MTVQTATIRFECGWATNSNMAGSLNVAIDGSVHEDLTLELTVYTMGRTFTVFPGIENCKTKKTMKFERKDATEE